MAQALPGTQQLTPAKTLDEVFKTLSPQPLMRNDEFKAFYRPEMNRVRGEDVISEMAHQLRRSIIETE